ncbi:MAG: DNA repair protein RecO [Methylobacter sp.]
MTESAVYLQPAFILQQRKYRESGLIIDVLTRDFGRISLLAKGVRKARSKTAGMLQPFIPLLISYLGKAELKTLTGVERLVGSVPASGIHSIPGDRQASSLPASGIHSIPGDNPAGSVPAVGIHAIPGDIIQPFNEIKGLALYCGFYINELVVCFLHKYDPHPEVFSDYGECLCALSSHGANLEAALRLFELNLMEYTGYGLQLEHDDNQKPIEPSKRYDFNAGRGPVEAANGQFSGKTLQALSARELTDPQVLSEAKILMRMVIDVYLQGRELKSRAVINKIMKHTSAE